MEYIKLGKTDINISKITFGCWAMGAGKEWGKSLADIEYQKTVMTAYENGINFFDTASGYGSGHSEEVLGDMIKNIRDKIIISTKCSSGALVKANAEISVDKSLKRLKTDYIDVFFIHWPNPTIDVRENMEQLLKLKEKGKIRAIGVSNFTVKHMEKALSIGQVDVLQPCYSLYFRQIEKDILPFCIDNDISIITYSSIAQGLLTGKFTKDWKFDETDMRNGQVVLFKKDVFEKAVDTTEKLRVYAEKYNKTLAQLAINWVINKKGITSAIVGAKKSSQVLENIKATNWQIEPKDHIEIGKICMDVANMVKDWDTMYQKEDKRMIIKE